VSSPLSKCASCHQQGHVGSKTLLQQNILYSSFFNGVSTNLRQLSAAVLFRMDKGRKPRDSQLIEPNVQKMTLDQE